MTPTTTQPRPPAPAPAVTGGGAPFDTDVAIVGGGPVGTLLAVLLGRRGHRVTIVEKWPAFYEQPRAITFDHEIARILAILGIDSDNDPAIDYHDDIYYWKNAQGRTLLEVDWASTAASGWRTRYWFSQPALEKRLRGLAADLPGVTTRCGWQATGLQQDDDGAVLTGSVTSTDGGTSTETLRAKYVVGADGANSFVRQALGLGFQDHGYFFDWLILDLIPNEPMPAEPTHWQLCDPARPTTIVPGGPGRRRWEFMVLPGENPAELASTDSAWNLLKPWGATPENCVLERSAVYRFQARWASSWRNGRGLIAGDAAHLMPPFAGEGMCAGLRDSLALAWRLDLVLSGKADQALLDSYGTERAGHVQHYITFSMDLGKIICITDPGQAAERDRRMIAELEASDGTPVDTDIAALGPGLWIEGTAHAGELSVQGIVEANGRTGRFDDVVGRGWTVIGRGENPAGLLTEEQRRHLEVLGGRCAGIGPTDGTGEVIDLEGTYGTWFDATGADYAILRPDFYVAATASTPEELRTHLDTLLDGLRLPTAHTPAIAAAATK